MGDKTSLPVYYLIHYSAHILTSNSIVQDIEEWGTRFFQVKLLQA